MKTQATSNPARRGRTNRLRVRASAAMSFLAGRAAIQVTGLTALLGMHGGCKAPSSHFTILDHRGPGQPLRFRETFNEAWYDIDGHGNIDLVLHRGGGPSGSAGGPEQVIHIRTIWRSIPGETVAETSQINAAIEYYILAGRTGASFRGAGSVFFKEDRDNGVLSGELELSVLEPDQRIGGNNPLFQRAEMRGNFHARRDPRRTLQLVHEMKRHFETGG